MRLKPGSPDYILLFTTLILTAIGLIMVFSSSAVTANILYNDPYYFFKRHAIWLVIGILAMLVCMKIPYQKLKHLALPLLVLAFITLILLLTPLGIEIKGATRWLSIGGFRFTPSEFAKLALVLFLAHSMSHKAQKMRSFKDGIMPYLLILAFASALIMAQPDLGTSVAIAGTVFFMLLMAGARISQLLLLATGGIAAVAAAISIADYRKDRLVAFLDPWKYAQGEGFQIIQSLYALGSGGLFGMGLGRSRQKFFYLPEQHTDFIFAILGEELGFAGALFIILLFVLLAWRGLKIALDAPDTFGSLLAGGITTMIVFQALINIGVVTGVLPVTGITLPFVSHGGTSLLISMIGVGLLLNISKYGVQERGAKKR